MENDRIEQGLLDEMSGYTFEMKSFLDLVSTGAEEYDGMVVEKITEVGQSLLKEIDDRIENLCSLIQTCLGDIEVEKRWCRFGTSARFPITGIIFHPGPMVKRVNWAEKVAIRIRPEGPTGRFTMQEKEALASVKAEARASEEIEREPNFQESVAQ